MKSARAEALRLISRILPWLFRIAIVDFFGADDFFETVFDLDDEDRRLDEDRDDTRPLSCAVFQTTRPQLNFPFGSPFLKKPLPDIKGLPIRSARLSPR